MKLNPDDDLVPDMFRGYLSTNRVYAVEEVKTEMIPEDVGSEMRPHSMIRINGRWLDASWFVLA